MLRLAQVMLRAAQGSSGSQQAYTASARGCLHVLTALEQSCFVQVRSWRWILVWSVFTAEYAGKIEIPILWLWPI
jgi:hypothetical protein